MADPKAGPDGKRDIRDDDYPELIPNAITIAAMQERDLKSFSSVAALMADLHEDDD